MKILLPIITAILFLSAKTNAQVRHPFKIQVIEGCEYFSLRKEGIFTHKGNCRNMVHCHNHGKKFQKLSNSIPHPFKIQIIEGCEYFILKKLGILAHKGNCKNTIHCHSE